VTEKRKGIPTDDPNVVRLPVEFTTDADAPAITKLESWDLEKRGCAHRNVLVDQKARKVTCRHCEVEVDPLVSLLDLGNWVRLQEMRYADWHREKNEARMEGDVYLRRIKPHAKYGSIHGHLIGYGGNGRSGIPKDALAIGDYVDHGYRYRVRKTEAGYEVGFWDPVHGLKMLATLTRPTLAKARTAVRHHWLMWNRNKQALKA